MHEAMASQPSELARILADPEPVESVATRIRGARRILLAGTGTSYHAANHGAYLLRLAGREAWAIEPFAATTGGPTAAAGDALIVLSHRNSKRYTTIARDEARRSEIRTVVISGIGAGGDIETVAPERSSAFTASHLGCLARLGQLARALGAELDGLEDVPDAVAQALGRPRSRRAAPREAARVHRRGNERVDGGRGCAEGAGDVVRRDGGALRGAAPARARGRPAAG